MKDKLRISVIIATYNRATLLASALEALVMQQRPCDEVIVVDNNSTDDTRAVAMTFESRLPLKYVFEARQGVAIARNTGVRNSSGDILAFTDDDCVPNPTWLHFLEMPFLRDPAIGLTGGLIVPFGTANSVVEKFCSTYHLMCEEIEA